MPPPRRSLEIDETLGGSTTPSCINYKFVEINHRICFVAWQRKIQQIDRSASFWWNVQLKRFIHSFLNGVRCFYLLLSVFLEFPKRKFLDFPSSSPRFDSLFPAWLLKTKTLSFVDPRDFETTHQLVVYFRQSHPVVCCRSLDIDSIFLIRSRGKLLIAVKWRKDERRLLLTQRFSVECDLEAAWRFWRSINNLLAETLWASLPSIYKNTSKLFALNWKRLC